MAMAAPRAARLTLRLLTALATAARNASCGPADETSLTTPRVPAAGAGFERVLIAEVGRRRSP
jgi:hypothetical protein